MKLDKFLTSILVAIEPEYAQYVQPNGTCVVKLSKALYGCIESARIWYDQISAKLNDMGYVKNPYDMCIFNKIENDNTQTTICLYVDDMFITSSNEIKIDDLVNELQTSYPNLEVKRGKQFSYLGMMFDFSVRGEVNITMPAYTDSLLKKCAHIKGGVSKHPADKNLFHVNENATKLNTADTEFYHSIVASCLFLGKRVRPEILTTVSFLSKRVNNPDADDLAKLTKLIQYLRYTKDLGLTLTSNDNILELIAYVDASYGVHMDMRSHTGIAISLGKGVIYCKSSTQKLNTKSSTESELIALSDSIGQIVWTRNFMMSQGYNLGPAHIYQDNQAVISLIKNGQSNSERTRHIAIRYFFVKDRVESNEVKISYLPTEDMIADILTKPLVGSLFNKLRQKLLNSKE